MQRGSRQQKIAAGISEYNPSNTRHLPLTLKHTRHTADYRRAQSIISSADNTTMHLFQRQICYAVTKKYQKYSSELVQYVYYIRNITSFLSA